MNGNPEPEARSGVRIEASERQTAEQLQAIRRGDSDAFEALARENAPALFRTALRLTGRREDAEDLVQEVLVRALPALRRFEGRAKLSTYLFRAMGNLWKNQLRSKKRSRVVEWFRTGQLLLRVLELGRHRCKAQRQTQQGQKKDRSHRAHRSILSSNRDTRLPARPAPLDMAPVQS